MDHASSASRWLRPWRPAQSRAEIEHDAADLGTCFGLDMSLDDPALPAAPALHPARAPWWARWSGAQRTPDAGAD